MMTLKLQHIRTSVAATTLAAALLVLAGCGGGSDSGKTKVKPKAEAKVAATEAQPAEDTRLAAAVVSGKTSAPVDLKYDLSAKPKSAVPFEIELVFQPRLPADVLEVEITGMPGLTVAQQGTFRFEKVQPETPYTQKITVQADADGTYYVSVLARMITQVQTEVRTFSVPVVVGTAPVVAKPAPATDAAGEAIQPMPATEPKR